MNPTNNKVRSLVTNNTFSDLDDRISYNENINHVPESFKNIQLLGSRGILVKMYKFTKHTTSRGGLITQKYKSYTKDSGKPGVNLDDFLYQARAVIVHMSPEAKKVIKDTFEPETADKLVVGTTVWIHPGNGVSPNNQFLFDREHPVVEQIDYLVIHPSHIEAVETSTPVKDIVYVAPEVDITQSNAIITDEEHTF